eukprot:gene7036-8392_t
MDAQPGHLVRHLTLSSNSPSDVTARRLHRSARTSSAARDKLNLLGLHQLRPCSLTCDFQVLFRHKSRCFRVTAVQRGSTEEEGPLEMPPTCPPGANWWKGRKATQGRGAPPVVGCTKSGERYVRFTAPVDVQLSRLILAALNCGLPEIMELRLDARESVRLPFEHSYEDGLGGFRESQLSAVRSRKEGSFGDSWEQEDVLRIIHFGAVWVRKFKASKLSALPEGPPGPREAMPDDLNGAGVPGRLIPEGRHERESLIRRGSVVTVYPCPRRFYPSIPPWTKAWAGWRGCVLFEDAEFLVVNKPANIPCQPVRSNARECLSRLYREETGTKVWVLHRLDLWTSGCLVLGKSAAAAAIFNQQMRSLQTEDEKEGSRGIKKVRAQLAAAGAPLVGDTVYGPLNRMLWREYDDHNEMRCCEYVKRLALCKLQTHHIGLQAAEVEFVGRGVNATAPWWAPT